MLHSELDMRQSEFTLRQSELEMEQSELEMEHIKFTLLYFTFTFIVRLLFWHTVVFLFDDGVAFTGKIFESVAVCNSDITA